MNFDWLKTAALAASIVLAGFFIGNMHWPAFNVADSAITVGITIFLVHVVLGRMPE